MRFPSGGPMLLAMSTHVTGRSAPLPGGPQPSAATRRMAPGAKGRERIALGILLLGTAILFTWNLAASGWANAYYSAAVQAGSRDWLAMLFGSFDAGNAITVDKTPASLWVMELSARIFGFSSWSVLLPQAIEGVLAVWLLYLAVRRRFGPLAGLIAGAVLALTPVATLMFRYNNPDALLTLLLVAATYATVRALEHASTRWLVLAGVAIGFAFLAKMLQGFLLIPTFAAVYLLAAPTGIRRRAWQVGAAALAVIVSAGWWVALVMLWPSAARPYIGGSQSNSVIELMLGYNGLGRLTGDEVGRVGGGGGPFSQDAGWLRLFSGELASQVAWLIPAALVAMVALIWLRRRAPRTDQARAQALLWGGWLITTGLVFSLMQGIFHSYYAVALAPAIGALVGIGAGIAWRLRRQLAVRLAAAATLVGSAAWTATLLARSPRWFPWLTPVILGASIAAAVGLVFLAALRDPRVRAAVFSVGLTGLLAAPAVGSIATAVEAHTGALPTAQPSVQVNGFGRGGSGFGFGAAGSGSPPGGAGPFPGGIAGRIPGLPRDGSAPNRGFPNGGPPALAPQAGFGGVFGRGGPSGRLGGLLYAARLDAALVNALEEGADDYTWVAATTGANSAAGVALATGRSVMAIGGFNGSDPSPTLEEFQRYVAAGEIHYYLAGANAAGFRGTRGGSDVASQIASWVDANFTATTIGGITVYDLSGAA